MINLNQNSQVPIYEQIKLGFKGLVKKDLLKPGDTAPSIRKMAADLKVNPNTVARSYRELTAEGFFESSRGQENVIARRASVIAKNSVKKITLSLETAIQGARDSGFSWDELEKIISDLKRKIS